MSAVAPAPAPARATFVESSSRRAPRASAETLRAPAPLARARNALTPRVVASHPTRGRVVVRLAPRAVAAGGSDLKIGATPDDDDSPDLARSDDGAPANPELADDADDADHLRTETDGGGGGSGEGGGGEGGSGGSGSGGSGSGGSGSESESSGASTSADAAATLAGWAAAAAEKASEFRAVDGGLRAGAASLFAANLATWTTMRAAAGREARGAERRRADDARVAAAAEAEKLAREEAAAAEYEKAELAKAELEDEERRRAKALVAASDAASVASRLPDSVASPAPAIASITALATVNQVTQVAAEAEERAVGGFAGEDDVASANAASDAAASSPARGMPFAVIPSDAEDPRVVAALQDAAEAQVAAADAMRAAAAATRAAADATAAAQLLQTAIAAGADAGEDAPASRVAADVAKQNAADAERAAATAELAAARHVARGERTGVPSSAAMPLVSVPAAAEESPAKGAARAVGRVAGACASAVAVAVRRGAPVVVDGVRSFADEHGPKATRHARSLAGVVAAKARDAWRGVDVETVARNGRTVVTTSPGLKQRLAGGYEKIRRLSGLRGAREVGKKIEKAKEKKDATAAEAGGKP